MVKNAKATVAVQKINQGLLDALAIQDIEDLFDVLDRNEDGTLDMQEISVLMQGALDRPCSDEELLILAKSMDKDLNDMVTSREFRDAIVTGDIRIYLDGKRESQILIEEQIEAMRTEQREFHRDTLVGVLRDRVHRDDAIGSLPYALVYYIIFLLLVVVRLRIYQRYEVEHAVENWVLHYGDSLTGPYLKEHVANLDGMWRWLNTSGAGALFGDCHNIEAHGNNMCSLAESHLLVGDAQVVGKLSNGTEVSEFLLHSNEAQAFLASNPGNLLGAAKMKISLLKEQGWLREMETDSLMLVFSTYSQRSEMFTVCRMGIAVDDSGMAYHPAISRSTLITAYPSYFDYILDICFVSMVPWPLSQELLQMASNLRHMGIREGWHAYWNFWNVVDWLNVLFTLAIAALWGVICMAMQDDRLLNAVDGSNSSRILRGSVMDYDVSALEDLRRAVEEVFTLFISMHMVMAFNVMTILLKCFKGFEANDHLRIVTMTIGQSGVDIFHFSVVFFTMFFTFATAGHVLFGRDIKEFSSMGDSIDTAHITLMGDFDWYLKLVVYDFELPSGSPAFLVHVWFWLYTVFIVLIVLNMLLAIVLEHYASICELVRTGTDPIWTQVFLYLKRMRETKGHIPLEQVLCMLENPDDPAHPEDLVTKTSLMDAFQRMSDTQAVWITEWLRCEQEKKKTEEEESEIQRLIVLEDVMQIMAREVMQISITASQGLANIALLEAAKGIPQDEIVCHENDRDQEFLVKSTSESSYPLRKEPEESYDFESLRSEAEVSGAESVGQEKIYAELQDFVARAAEQSTNLESNLCGEAVVDVIDLRRVPEGDQPSCCSFGLRPTTCEL